MFFLNYVKISYHWKKTLMNIFVLQAKFPLIKALNRCPLLHITETVEDEQAVLNCSLHWCPVSLVLIMASAALSVKMH